MTASKSSINRHLLITERGQSWLGQFAPNDESTAAQLVNGLTLVSQSSFERVIDKMIRRVGNEGYRCVGLFAAREFENKDARSKFINDLTSGETIDAVGRG